MDDPRIEAAARAYYEWATMNDGEDSRWDEPGLHQGFARSRVEVILAAADAVDPVRVREVALREEYEQCLAHIDRIEAANTEIASAFVASTESGVALRSALAALVEFAALKPNVEDCLRHISSDDYPVYARTWDGTRTTLTAMMEAVGAARDLLARQAAHDAAEPSSTLDQTR